MRLRIWIARLQQRAHNFTAQRHLMAREWHKRQADKHLAKATAAMWRRLSLKEAKAKR